MAPTAKDPEAAQAAREEAKELAEHVKSSTAKLVDEMALKVNDAELKGLKIIGAHLVNGMSRQEAAILALMDYEQLELLSRNHPEVEKFLRFKEMRFKATLLESMTKGARLGDTKDALALLEQKYPEEFLKKAKPHGGGGDKDDRLKQALDHAREQGDDTPLVPVDAPVASGFVGSEPVTAP